ncbi:hypothetical protein ACNOYE_07770 [Nannocystaceae bacterium ST9]
MAIEDRTRHDRLRSLLPRTFATEPSNSALGVVVEVLADALRETDQFVERALRDRWLRTSSGSRSLLPVIVATRPSGWLSGPSLPNAMRVAAQADADALSLRVAGLYASGPTDARVIVGEFDEPLYDEQFETTDAALERMRVLLKPLKLSLASAAPEAIEARTTTAGNPLVWARWQLSNEALELGLASAGPFTALILLRGPIATAGYRSSFDALLAGLTGLSDGERPPLPEVSLDGPQLPLELLGAALAIGRQPWESDHEAYRNRVRILGPLLAEGLGTPRVLLAATLTSLGSEPCPVLERPESDSTRGYGLPPRSLDRCRVCKGGKRVAADAVCPLRSRAIMRARVTDNPRTRSVLTRTSLDPAPNLDEVVGGAGRIRVRNDSLFSARPEIVLSVPSEAAPETKVIPSFRSLTTGEEIVLPAVIRPGEVLTVRPAQPSNPPLRHQQYWVDPPSGEFALPARAWIRREVDGIVEITELQEVSLFAQGPRFDQARFASASDSAVFDEGHWDQTTWDESDAPPPLNAYTFAAVSRKAETPELRPGNNDWIYRPLSGADLDSLLTDYQLDAEELGLADLEFAASTERVSLELRWWTRPPARFRVRVIRTPAVERALASGAAETMRQMIDRVRPVGVLPIIDFALEPFVDQVDPEDHLRAIAVRGFEALAPEDHLQVESTLQDQAEPDEQFGFIGIFDVTRFTISRFGPKPILPGEFDHTEFDWSTANPIEPPDGGEFDITYFDHALLTDPLPGNFEDAEWDGDVFD